MRHSPKVPVTAFCNSLDMATFGFQEQARAAPSTIQTDIQTNPGI